ncbi:MAG: fdrA domain protein [Candidatus Ozemobacteraceae bacterium]
MKPLNDLFNQTLKVINVGIPSFADDLKVQGASVIHVEWRPPAGGNKKVASLLDRIMQTQKGFKKL